MVIAVCIIILFLVGVSWGACVLYAGHMPNARFSNALYPHRPFVDCGCSGMVVLFTWLVFALSAYVVCLLLGVQGTFSACLLLVTFCSFPRYVSWFVTPMRNWSYRANALHKKILLWSAYLSILIAIVEFRAEMHLSFLQACLVTATYTFILFKCTRSEMKTLPECLSAFAPWKRYPHGLITLWYTETIPVDLPPALNKTANQIVHDISKMLDYKEHRNTIDIFVFTDQEQYEIAINMHELQIRGSAFNGGCTLLYSNWEDAVSILTHELCHVLVRFQPLTPSIPTLLDEGLAMYVTHELLYVEAQKPACSLLTDRLHKLIDDQEFDKWQSSPEPVVVRRAYYRYGYSFVEYLIRHYGIRQFKQFCEVLYLQRTLPPSQRLNLACRSVYGILAIDLEAEWRSHSPSFEQPSSQQLHAIGQPRKRIRPKRGRSPKEINGRLQILERLEQIP